MSQKYYTHTEQRVRACTLFTVIHMRGRGVLALIISSEGALSSLPTLLSHQASAIHSLIVGQSRQTKLALYFLALTVATGMNSH